MSTKLKRKSTTQDVETHFENQIKTVTVPTGTILYRGANEEKLIEPRTNAPGWFGQTIETAIMYATSNNTEKGFVGTFKTFKPLTLVQMTLENVKQILNIALDQFGLEKDNEDMVLHITRLLNMLPIKDRAYKKLTKLRDYYENTSDQKTILHLDEEFREIVARKTIANHQYEALFVNARLSKHKPVNVHTDLLHTFPIIKNKLHRNSNSRRDAHVVEWMCKALHIQGFIAERFESDEHEIEQHEEIMICPFVLENIALEEIESVSPRTKLSKNNK